MAEFHELRLTSPHMKGPEVRKAQKALNHNRFGDFLPGKIDGDFGPITAGAVKAAKYALGYPKRKVDQHYDERLDGALNGKHDISPLMKRRRQARTKKASGNVKVRALEIGLKEVGTKESPANSNRQKYGEWYGFNGVPWCAIFFSWCANKAGSEIFHPGYFAYCPNLTIAAARGDHGLRFTNDPEKGDAVLYQFDSDPEADHVERFIEWTTKSHTSFRALGGNTSASGGSASNGGEVAVNTRARSLVQHFIRIPE